MNYLANTTLNSGAIREEDYVTTEEAAEIFGLKRSQARAILGEPDSSWLCATGQVQYIYLRSRVLDIKSRREEQLRKRRMELGQRSCYYCRKRFVKSDLCDGLCAECQAKKLVKNFACHGDCFRHELDIQRVRLLMNACDVIISQDTKN